MPTIQENLEVLITGKAQSFVTAARTADSELGRLQTRMLSFRELGESFGEKYERGFETIKGALEGAGEEQAVLTRTVGAFKGAISGPELDEWSKGLEKVTGVRHDRLQQVAGILGSLGANPEQAEQLVVPILNVEQALKATGITAEGAARAIAIALRTGDPGRLRRSGIILDPRAQAQFEGAGIGAEAYAKRLAILQDALKATGGDALAQFRQTLPGATEALNTSITSLKAALAEPLVKPITDLANAATNLVYGFEQLPGPIKEVIAYGGVALVGALGLASIAFKGLAFWQSYQIAKLIEATQETNKLKTATDRLAGSQGKAAIAAEEEALAEGGVGGAGKRAAGRKGGGFLGSGGGIGGVLASLGIELGAQWAQSKLGETDWNAPDKSFGRFNTQIKNVGLRGAQGAGFGAFAGPEGALVGGLIGGIGGAIENILHDTGVIKPGAAKKSPEAEASEKLAAELAKNTAATEGLTGTISRGSVSTSEVALYRQLGARRVVQFSG